MKFLRYGPTDDEKPGLLDPSGTIRDLSAQIDDLARTNLSPRKLAELAEIDPESLPAVGDGMRIGPCVGLVGKFICIGLNYSDHVVEAGMEVPEEPLVFFKATSAVCGPNDDIEIPRNSVKTDWEVELGVVVGKRAKNIEVGSALEYVAGYCVVNDLSERAFQLERGGQWVKGKSHDTFGPIGPWLVTTDEIVDPHKLNLWLEVDGHRYQDGNTNKMIFDVPTLVSYLSQFMTLEPGDVITTGTPPGVGLGQKPEPVYLTEGQQMRLGVEGLGEQCQRTVAYRE